MGIVKTPRTHLRTMRHVRTMRSIPKVLWDRWDADKEAEKIRKEHLRMEIRAATAKARWERWEEHMKRVEQASEGRR
ncbi:MAG: hypothetical protein ACE5JS_23450 [Nitrospinota bacterium]